MRANPTPAELQMWRIINERIYPLYPNHVFYPQFVAFGYIMDFFCPTAKLGIELDGSVHSQQRAYDWQRDSNLAAKGIQMIRFPNAYVFNYPQDTANILCQYLHCKTMQTLNYCPYCGAKLEINYFFCGACGNKVG
jgi:very-short-patch-repair endonuclease